MRPDDFPRKLTHTLAMRAAFRCCNPGCRVLTVQPHSDPAKALHTGIASHVCGASPGGPRYDPLQSPEERRGIENGIWLCAACAQLVDKDESAYPPELLLKWKRDHELWIANSGIMPDLPEIAIVTSAGLPVPQGAGATIDGKTHEHLRHHTLSVANRNDTSIMQFEAQITLAEPVTGARIAKRPTGIEVVFGPYHSPMQAIVHGGGKVTRLRAQSITAQLELGIERLPAQGVVRIEFLTSNGESGRRYMEFVGRPLLGCEPDEDEQYLRYYLAGRFQYEYRGATLSREVFAPILYDASKRTFSIVEVREDYGNWQPLTLEGMF